LPAVASSRPSAPCVKHKPCHSSSSSSSSSSITERQDQRDTVGVRCGCGAQDGHTRRDLYTDRQSVSQSVSQRATLDRDACLGGQSGWDAEGVSGPQKTAARYPVTCNGRLAKRPSKETPPRRSVAGSNHRSERLRTSEAAAAVATVPTQNNQSATCNTAGRGKARRQWVIPLQNCRFTPELQWQSRGKWRILQGCAAYTGAGSDSQSKGGIKKITLIQNCQRNQQEWEIR
jgi:hypothetical protein